MALHVAHRRQYERRAVDIPVDLVVADVCREQVAPLAGATVRGRMTNVSGGGAQVISATFLPRSTLVDLQIPPQRGVPDGTARARVMKVRMTDAEPHYTLGLRFEDENEPLVCQLRAGELAASQEE